ncbi:hypothetical protein H2O64_12580 [Kordia sp. YSTF-M3]|uniref:Uncharacterized protein n=1 Tax=Kordia aestuariivivens TaxID=2759037 RepID=A0ABR7QAB4_9FLAO|nr:hypothetical protein [Kordia aestuariivivens]MBC8755505.1 hypothetical protein [Kordia aestuariivivens]
MILLALSIERGGVMYFRKTTAADNKLEEFLGLIIHEGTHALESIVEASLDFKEQVLKFGNIHSKEKRAYFYQRQFQIEMGFKLDFRYLNEISKFVKNNYKKI